MWKQTNDKVKFFSFAMSPQAYYHHVNRVGVCTLTHKESFHQKESQMATLLYLMKLLSVTTSLLVNLLMKITILLPYVLLQSPS